MIYKADANIRGKLFYMFKDMDDTMLLSYLQGYMGTAWVNDPVYPTAAQIIVGVFVFYAGDPEAAGVEELLDNLPPDSIVIVHSDQWKSRVENAHQGSMEKFQRYAFKKNPKYLDINHIHAFLATLPEGYELRKIDEKLANDPSLQQVSEDFTKQFDSIDNYINKGIGYCIIHNGIIVCGASSYSIYNDGIEIEIDTHPEHRRKGLATVAVSALIIDCLERGKYPNWDAANTNSVALAEKLGYVLDKPYDAYYFNKTRVLI